MPELTAAVVGSFDAAPVATVSCRRKRRRGGRGCLGARILVSATAGSDGTRRWLEHLVA